MTKAYQMTRSLKQKNFPTFIILGLGSEVGGGDYDDGPVFSEGLAMRVQNGGCSIVQGARIS